MSHFRPHRCSADCMEHLVSAQKEVCPMKHKTFDALPHDTIPQYLRLSFVSVRLLRNSTTFLTKRTFRVRDCDVRSDIRPITPGVRQVSALCPILFNLVFSSLPCCYPGRFGRMSVHIEIYANDIVFGPWPETNRNIQLVQRSSMAKLDYVLSRRTRRSNNL